MKFAYNHIITQGEPYKGHYFWRVVKAAPGRNCRHYYTCVPFDENHRYQSVPQYLSITDSKEHLWQPAIDEYPENFI